ncbi:unnamed protein product [Closterium sp. NIES-65]|nr:unnamed protein product [Closterium sp. NIES-65]
MEVARSSMIHAAAPHILWPFAVRYAANQLDLWPRVSLPETSPTLRWTGEVGDASVFRVDPLPLADLVEVAVDSGAAGGGVARGAASGGAEPEHVECGGAEPGVAESEGAEPRGAESERVEPGGAVTECVETGGAESGGAEPGGTVSAGGPTVPSSGRELLSRLHLCKWFARRTSLRSGAAGAGGPAAGDNGAEGTGADGASGTAATGGARSAGLGVPRARGAGAAGPGGAHTGGIGAAGAGGVAAAEGAGGDCTGGTRAAGAGGAAGTGAGDLGAKVAGAGGAGAVGTGMHDMALLPSSSPLRVSLPSPPASSHPDVLDLEFDLVRAARPTVTRLLAAIVTDPSFESTAASALVAELVHFAATCRLDYAASLVAESESVCPTSVEGECALDTGVLKDRQEDFECLAATVPHLVSMPLAPEGDRDAPNIRPRALTVKRPPGSPPVFKARYIARGFSQRHGVEFFQTFSPTLKMTTLQVLLHVAAQRHYELHSLDFSTAFLQGSLHEEIWLRRPCGFTGSFPEGT